MKGISDGIDRLDGNDYTAMITRCTPRRWAAGCWCAPIWIGVQVFCDGQSVAEHTRIWAAHQTISDPVHVEAAKVLRRCACPVHRTT